MAAFRLWRAFSAFPSIGARSPQDDTPGGEKPSTCSVIIPAYNERESIVRTIESCRRLARRPALLEIVVVDGGSTDGTLEALECVRAETGPPVVVLSARGGRGCALRAGAEAARGEMLLMLHAECSVPQHYDELCAETLADPSVILGAFSFRIDRASFRGERPPLGIDAVEHFANVRSRPPACLPYGDQGLHMRAADLRAIGGVPAVAIMEDVMLVRRLLAAGADARPQRCLRVRAEAVECSGRRWEEHGVVKVTLYNQLFMLAHFAGCSPDDIYRAYYGRPPPAPPK
jgi:hypothetical protein